LFGWNCRKLHRFFEKPDTNEWLWFNVGAGITKTVIYRITMPANASIGSYYINGKIANASRFAAVSGENTISSDILSYYRSLGSNPNCTDTTDLLKAADDWRRNLTAPGFVSPITTIELLNLADEWSSGC